MAPQGPQVEETRSTICLSSEDIQYPQEEVDD